MSRAPHPRNPILIVDDEYFVVLNLSVALKSHGLDNVMTCQDGRQVMQMLSEHQVEVLLLDLTMPHVSGQQLLPRIREEHPELPVIIITGGSDVPTAVECMKLGVFDYLVKSIEEGKLIATVSRAMEFRELRRENLSLRDHLVGQGLEHPEALGGMVHQDARMRAVLMYAESIARGSQTVLVTGETGVGKELVARGIHNLSGRTGDFVAVNVAGLDETMFSDSLFGHVKGAYTGATHDRRGLVGAASGGTLFLDEIGDLDVKSQISLLRLLETHEYYPLGSDLSRRTDARIIVATNRDPAKGIREGSFRRDLYYRLQTHHVHVPPLRERPDDLPVLLEHFLTQACAEYGRQPPELPGGLAALLRRQSFPGNVRELRSVVFDVVSQLGDLPLTLEVFQKVLGSRTKVELDDAEEAPLEIRGKFPSLREATSYVIQEALRRTAGNQARAASMLGISAAALSRRLRRGGSAADAEDAP